MNHVCCNGHRRGLTLIELVLAAAGCSLLLILIASLLATQAKLMTRCQQTVEITRASLRLSQWLREDLSQLPVLQDGYNSISSGTSIGERVLQFDIQLADSPLQVYGTHESLAMSHFEPADGSNGEVGASQLLCTIWSDASARSPSIPYLSADQQVRFQPLPAVTARPNGSIGVARNQYQVGKQAIQRRSTSFAEAAASIRFRYFDGQRWHERWDSHERQGLPRAIEFAIQYNDGTEPQRFVQALTVFRTGAPAEFGS